MNATMEAKLHELKMRLIEINDLESAHAVLRWDQATYMPAAGAMARSRQMGTLGRIAHEKFTKATIGTLLDELELVCEDLDYGSDEASLVRVVRRQYDKATKVPTEFVAKLREHSAASYQIWTEARRDNDFDRVIPVLEETVDMSRQLANHFPGYEHIADPLIDYRDHGMTVSTLRHLFDELIGHLVPMVRSLENGNPAEDEFLHQHFDESQQLQFGEKVIKDLGYDFNRGRQDKTHHPFMTRFAGDDVRITMRVNPERFGPALFSQTHECGHALYELGIARGYDGTPLARGTSAGVHESQARMWENLVSRSYPFWEHYYPILQDIFPTQLRSITLSKFYNAINKVEASCIRTGADEVTYNFHTLIRFKLELQMLEGTLAVKDLAEAWHSSYESNLGVRADSDRDGVLQDVHWFAGSVGGAFQGYTLGNILGAQFFEAARKAHPEISQDMRVGSFDNLHGWLKHNIYRHGSKFTASELVERVTGSQMTIGPYIKYLKAKYGEL